MSDSNVNLQLTALVTQMIGALGNLANTFHTCSTHYVPVGEAARAAGVPYQYVYGMAQRNYKSKRARVSVIVELHPYTGKKIFKVCKQCILDHYGSASAQTAELLATPLIGYRSFYIKDNLLTSWYETGFSWLPDGVEAVCSHGKHTPPGNRCTCGLYALSKPDRNMYKGDVLGQVELWGHFREGDRGWRAQWGKPTALLCEDWHKADDIHKVAKLYRIPVTHSIELLQRTDWGEYTYTDELLLTGGGEDSGYRQGEEDGRGSSTEGARTSSDRAACREATATTGSLEGLRFLYQAGEISVSNLQEVLDARPPF